MAKKNNIPADEKIDNEVDLFEILAAIDNKDYGYYSALTDEQKKKVFMVILISWAAATRASADIQKYYLQSINYHANKYFLNEAVSKHPELQWLMLCAASPGIGKQFHHWIPQISNKVAKLREPANLSDIKKYYARVYPKADQRDITAISKEFVSHQTRNCHLANIYPNLKQADIETLGQVITDEEVNQYEKDRGN